METQCYKTEGIGNSNGFGKELEHVRASKNLEKDTMRLRDLDLKVLFSLVSLLLTLFSMSATALWAVYHRPTEVKVQSMLDRQYKEIRRDLRFLRRSIDKNFDRQEKRLDRLSDRVRQLEKRR